MTKENIIDIALCLLGSDETTDWLCERGVESEAVSDAAADLYRERNPEGTFGLESVRRLIDGSRL